MTKFDEFTLKLLELSRLTVINLKSGEVITTTQATRTSEGNIKILIGTSINQLAHQSNIYNIELSLSDISTITFNL